MRAIDFMSYEEQEQDYRERKTKELIGEALKHLYKLEDILEYKNKKLGNVINKLQSILSS